MGKISFNNKYLMRIILAAIAAVIVAGIVIGTRAVVTVVKRNTDIREIEKKYPDAVITPSGLRYIVLEEGNGPKPLQGRPVRVNYKGSLLSGREFDNTDNEGRPLEFDIGVGQVIRGFDEAVIEMREGERRLLIIPPELGYGKRSVGNGIIPANSFLIFELELFRVR